MCSARSSSVQDRGSCRPASVWSDGGGAGGGGAGGRGSSRVSADAAFARAPSLWRNISAVPAFQACSKALHLAARAAHLLAGPLAACCTAHTGSHTLTLLLDRGHARSPNNCTPWHQAWWKIVDMWDHASCFDHAMCPSLHALSLLSRKHSCLAPRHRMPCRSAASCGIDRLPAVMCPAMRPGA
jgi:hypothetical protein